MGKKFEPIRLKNSVKKIRAFKFSTLQLIDAHILTFGQVFICDVKINVSKCVA